MFEHNRLCLVNDVLDLSRSQPEFFGDLFLRYSIKPRSFEDPPVALRILDADNVLIDDPVEFSPGIIKFTI